VNSKLAKKPKLVLIGGTHGLRSAKMHLSSQVICKTETRKWVCTTYGLMIWKLISGLERTILTYVSSNIKSEAPNWGFTGAKYLSFIMP
jgi:hypothetical protein